MQAHLIITGSVQGVGFRQFVKKHAQELGLTGLVRNLSDGSVEVIAQGSQNQIEHMIALCKKGPFLADVTGVAVVFTDSKETYNEFVILHE